MATRSAEWFDLQHNNHARAPDFAGGDLATTLNRFDWKAVAADLPRHLVKGAMSRGGSARLDLADPQGRAHPLARQLLALRWFSALSA